MNLHSLPNQTHFSTSLQNQRKRVPIQTHPIFNHQAKQNQGPSGLTPVRVGPDQRVPEKRVVAEIVKSVVHVENIASELDKRLMG
ncbi:hypothetical protein GYH30_001528 [Glycine max]|uniref:Uncharacterized protein n=2 Tax=Glycine subgen. Soja TaxID=1462606 RepID=A0A0R0LHE0_SOYBN|nr:hypothetical protein GYH30_001528 [Glycine max]RZC29905.1 hypothetical protein D0Y65_001497 [Glycine soja]